jgi:tetratricopeptide (TPR) repeat protein
MLASLRISSSRPRLWRGLRLFSACLLGSFVLGALQLEVALGQQSTVYLEGEVRTDAGATPSSGVKVRIETDEGNLIAEQPANSDGAFHFENLPKMNCRLVVTADGFEPHQEPLDLRYGSIQNFRNITLRPVHKVKESLASAPARSDDLAPKNAKREYEEAERELAAKNFDGAKAHLANAVKEFPCYARAQTDLGTILEARRDLAGAEGALKKARECDPDYIDSYIVLGHMLNSQKRFADSEPILQEGMRRSPGSWQFYYQLGVAHFGLGQYSKAQSEYQKVLELNPIPPPEFRVKLADLELKEKAYDKAYSQMQEYLKAEPNGRFAPRVKSIMEQMKASGVLSQPAPAKQ